MKNCANCGIGFKPLGSRSKCCSLKCRILAASKKDENNDCINWQGAVGSHGYGVLNIMGDVVCAHRLAYELFVEPVQQDAFVCHKCDNRICVNPKHLFVGTAQDNAIDMVNKGRHWIKGKTMPEHYRARLRVPKMMREG